MDKIVKALDSVTDIFEKREQEISGVSVIDDGWLFSGTHNGEAAFGVHPVKVSTDGNISDFKLPDRENFRILHTVKRISAYDAFEISLYYLK